MVDKKRQSITRSDMVFAALLRRQETTARIESFMNWPHARPIDLEINAFF